MDEKVKGYVKSYIYKNDENGYVIAKLETDNNEVVTIVGYFPLLNEELLYEFTGETVNHKKFGKQFKVNTYTRVEDTSESGLVRYLASDDFTGIGPKTAQKIVDLLGANAINLIIEDESILSPILNPIKRVRLKKELVHHQVEHQIFITLLDYGLSNKVASKLYKNYGHETLEKLNDDPYRLMYEIEGFGFIKSADVAEKLGIPKSDIRSIKAAIVYVLDTTAFGEGDLYLSYDEISAKVSRLLNLDLDYHEALDLLVKEGKITFEDESYFLTDIYYAEISIAKRLLELNQRPKYSIDEELLKLMLSQISIQKNIDYTEKQTDAIISAMLNPITVITGGPGTGKTTLIDGFLNLYADYYKLKLKQAETKEIIALMAPTGRASKRMKELLNFDARTIHSHLGYDFDRSFKHNKKEPLSHQLIIVDEASMIDIFLAKRLLESVNDDARIVIVGDEDQLPSVGPGYVLGDIIASNTIPVIRLNEIHRQAKDSHIIKLASSINNQALGYDDLMSHQDVIFYKGDTSDIKRVIISQIKGALDKGYSLIDDIQVLIPLYKGDLGIDLMNKEIQKTFNSQFGGSLSMTYGDKTYYQGDKVIQLQNDKERQIMNGDIGVIERIIKNDKDVLTMQISFDETTVFYEQSDLENINLAYVISIHKSQGSEYKIVFLPIIRSYLHMLKKELIYTAITRAKEYLLILGDMNLLQYASNQLAEKRHTKLKERLQGNADKDLFDEEETEDPTKDISPYDFM